MTRRPRATVRTRRTEQLASGYCEICRIRYRDLAKHVQSDQHLSFVQNDDNFLSLDKLINAGANVEAFLKLNRGKNIEYVKYINNKITSLTISVKVLLNIFFALL